jgi:TPP-dependent pyruvate/acetoin dehydrogenase alpha subunit
MDQKILAEWKARDPLDILRSKIKGKKKIQEIEIHVESELEEAIEFAKNSPQPSVDEFLDSIPNY